MIILQETVFFYKNDLSYLCSSIQIYTMPLHSMPHFLYCRFVLYCLHPKNVKTAKPIQSIFYVGSSHDPKKSLWMVKNEKVFLQLLFLKLCAKLNRKIHKIHFSKKNGSLKSNG